MEHPPSSSSSEGTIAWRRFHRRDDIAAVLNYEMSKFTHGEAGGNRRLPHHWQQTVDTLGDFLKVYDCIRVQYFLNYCY